VWVHPVAGTVPPAELWALAERQAAGRELGRWLVQTACAELGDLVSGDALVVDVPGSVLRAEDLADAVLGVLDSGAIDAGRLVLNVSEHTVQTASPALLATLLRLRGLGLRLTLDGFGMGQSLFSHLDRVPFTGVGVRLDSLAAPGDLLRKERVLRAIVASVESLGLQAVALGVDDEDLLEIARAAGAHHTGGTVHPHDLTPDQVRRYLDQRDRELPGGASSVTTVPLPPILGA
jgi:EAL domain-containing protein (putative c-di-GMP-specific phosphodiesterase class I)